MNDTRLRGLSLFSGIGGIELGLQEWVRTIAYCEIDPYAQAVLRSRFGDGQLDDAPIFPDVTKLTAAQLPPIDIITGGFPCQDISNAGKRRGIHAERSGLWFEMHRLVGELRPRYLFVENVSALTNRGLDVVLGSLSEIGYDAVWTTLRASDVGAPHRRERVFILAYPNSQRCDANECRGQQDRGEGELWAGGAEQPSEDSGPGYKVEGAEVLPDPSRDGVSRCPIRQGQVQSWRGDTWWGVDPADLDPSSESYVGRVADGVPHRVDRIKCLGNAVVPAQAREAFIRLITIKEETG